MNKQIKIIFLEQAEEFFSKLPDKAKKKITYNMLRISNGEINKELFKKLGDTDIWEFRTIWNDMCYRLFAFWHNGQLIVVTHGIVKKTQKTPKSEIEKAENIRKDYLKNR